MSESLLIGLAMLRANWERDERNRWTLPRVERLSASPEDAKGQASGGPPDVQEDDLVAA